MVGAMDARTEAVLAYCGWQNVGLPGTASAPFVPPDYENCDKAANLFAGCRWPIHAALVRREVVMAANGFDPGLRHAEDYALWLRAATSGPIVRVPSVLAFYHFHGHGQASDDRARAALQHLQVQQAYLRTNPGLAAQLGSTRVRDLTAGELLKRGYACYWQRDLAAARTIFRAVMSLRYGTLSDWKYMLPACLPESWHRRLITMRDRDAPTPDGPF
jgi:GT2 family glycosyltransferase